MMKIVGEFIMGTPLTMFDKVSFDLKNDNFLFVSYSHLDDTAVYEILNSLYDSHVNYWYDTKLRVGDEWDNVVNNIINNSHCVGTLFFLSKNYIKSDSCKKEYETIKKLNHLVIPILLEGENVSSLYNNLSKNEIAIDNNDEDFLFKDNVLFYNYQKDSIDKILITLREKTKRVINDKSGLIQILLEKKITYNQNNFYLLNFGLFPQNNPLTLNRYANDRIIEDEYSLKYYGCKKDNKFYPFEQIAWKILDVDEQDVYLISNNCFLAAYGNKNDILKVLNDFYNVAFNDIEKENISLSYLDYQTYQKYYDQIANQNYEFSKLYLTNYPYFKNIFWIVKDDKVLLMNNDLTNIVDTVNNYEDVIAGILPIIKIKINYIK